VSLHRFYLSTAGIYCNNIKAFVCLLNSLMQFFHADDNSPLERARWNVRWRVRRTPLEGVLAGMPVNTPLHPSQEGNNIRVYTGREKPLLTIDSEDYKFEINTEIITLNFMFGDKLSVTVPLNLIREAIESYLETKTDFHASITSS